MSDEELGEHVYKALKAKRYLVVIDDTWSIKAWDVLKRYFPNDRNGSRIVFTTRLVNVAMALQAKPHHFSFLNEDESWNLLRFKVFRKGSCPIDLIEIGKEIVKQYRGLPLAIVVISGLLAKKDKTEEWWKHISGSVGGSYVFICMSPRKKGQALRGLGNRPTIGYVAESVDFHNFEKIGCCPTTY
ncbi:disease resistance protein RPP13-like [Cornus florida]|uniref:disease resistance protein RPP13-like n=1 Tax=Cornus florida TaxID=4283 RepID=UPI002896FD03|nr:disease resistance protein RPP13-like [Cornus florida]